MIEERRVNDLVLQRHETEEIQRYEDIKKELRELKEQVETLIIIWNQAKGALSVIKWIVGISGSITALILFIKDHVK